MLDHAPRDRTTPDDVMPDTTRKAAPDYAKSRCSVETT